MKNLKRNLGGIAVLGVLGMIGLSTVFAAGRTYLQYCSGSVYAPVCSGGYQDDIDVAADRAEGFMDEIRMYSSSQQQEILDTLITKLALYHMTTNNAYDQVLASYYHDYFKTERDGGGSDEDVDDLIRRLIDGSRTSSSTTRYTYTTRTTTDTPDNGKITAVSAGRNTTYIRNDRITARGELNLQIIAKEGNEMLQDTDVRVVAELYDGNRRVDTVAANERGSYWSLVLSDQFDRVDEIRIFLLCQDCRNGSSYQGSLFRNWRVLDTEYYDVTLTRTTNYDDRYYNDDYYTNRYSDENYDLEISNIDYQYDGNGYEVDVQVEVTVRNIGRYDNTLDRLEYEVEVDGRNLSSSRYDIDHIRTDCDSRVDRDDDRNLSIQDGDECEITVEFTFDQDEVEDERLEIMVEAVARRDDDTSNNEDDVRFYVD